VIYGILSHIHDLVDIYVVIDFVLFHILHLCGDLARINFTLCMPLQYTGAINCTYALAHVRDLIIAIQCNMPHCILIAEDKMALGAACSVHFAPPCLCKKLQKMGGTYLCFTKSSIHIYSNKNIVTYSPGQGAAGQLIESGALQSEE
jgi:hypothetical protein